MKDSSGTPTVLVVDDEPSIHSFLSAFLQGKGYRVRAVASANDAIALLRGARVDAIVLDVKMPGRSGLAVLEHVRFDPALHATPVLIFTGAALTAEEEALIASHRAYVFYKQEGLEEFCAYLDRLTLAQN